MTTGTEIRFDFAALSECQEKAAVLNFQRSPFLHRAVPHLADNVAFNLDFLQQMPFASPEKTTAIRVLGVDVMSHIAIASRIGFWGAIPQSIAILRGAVESVTVLASVVIHGNYKTAVHEINSRTNQLNFDNAAKSIESLGGNLKKLYGRMSNAGAHATAQRLRKSEYQFEGQPYDRIGCALDPKGVEAAIGFAMHPCILATEAFQMSLEREQKSFAKESDYVLLVDRFNALCDEFKASAGQESPRD